MPMIAALVVLTTLSSLQLWSQETPAAQTELFLRANDRFAFELLKTAHREFPGRNIAVAPLPVSLTFAALLDGGVPDSESGEIRSAFHWDRSIALPAASKMILARFKKPGNYQSSTWGAWLTAAFLHRGKGSLSQGFIDQVTRDFGIPFYAVGERTPQSKILAEHWDPSLPMPTVTTNNDFWITSVTHLRTPWAGNTFVDATREKRRFRLRAGGFVQADFLTSETNEYPYARTEEFEAAVLPGWKTTILLVLPSAHSSIERLEAAIASEPDLIAPLLTRRGGDVCLPPFHLSFDRDLRNTIETMGVRRIFSSPETLSSMAPMGALLRGVAQKTEITVDEKGIRADAGTIVSGLTVGGFFGDQAFHMTLDRPFLFFVRDTETKALLFEGAVMNPTLR